jgi:hypothetical protein
MAYRSLKLDRATPPTVRRLIHRLETLSFSDVHTMLRLPVPNYRLNAGCNFAITHVLTTAIGGISTTLYRRGTTDGERFKGLLVDHYPWALEPHQGVQPREAARVIYEVIRNPLTHDLGLDLKGKSKGLQVKVKRWQRPNQKGGMPEKWIENLEGGPSRPNISSAVTVRGDAQVLLVEALYWGLRRMAEGMTRDAQLMARAETFLGNKL